MSTRTTTPEQRRELAAAIGLEPVPEHPTEYYGSDDDPFSPQNRVICYGNPGSSQS